MNTLCKPFYSEGAVQEVGPASHLLRPHVRSLFSRPHFRQVNIRKLSLLIVVLFFRCPPVLSYSVRFRGFSVDHAWPAVAGVVLSYTVLACCCCWCCPVLHCSVLFHTFLRGLGFEDSPLCMAYGCWLSCPVQLCPVLFNSILTFPVLSCLGSEDSPQCLACCCWSSCRAPPPASHPTTQPSLSVSRAIDRRIDRYFGR